MTRSVALTGGIGSGKTTVGSMFKSLGVPVYVADVEAKNLMQKSKSIRAGLISIFGEEVYKNDALNKAYISKQLFVNPTKLKQMNALVHPAVAKHYKVWLSHQTTPYVIKESALIFELEAQHQFDFILTVTAPKSMRLNRVVKRDHKSITNIEAIMANQCHEEFKIKHSDFVIENIDLHTTREEVFVIHNKILKMINFF